MCDSIFGPWIRDSWIRASQNARFVDRAKRAGLDMWASGDVSCVQIFAAYYMGIAFNRLDSDSSIFSRWFTEYVHISLFIFVDILDSVIFVVRFGIRDI